MEPVVHEGPSVTPPRPAPFPHHYEVSLHWNAVDRGLLGAPPRPGILGGAPASFGGRDDWWSPEHLLLSALNLCLATTYQVFAEKEKLALADYRSDARGILDKTPSGLAFTSVLLAVSLRVAHADRDRALRTLESAKRHCIIANALKVPIELRATVDPA